MALSLDLDRIASEISHLSQANALRIIEGTSLKKTAPEQYHALRAEVFFKGLHLDKGLFEIESSLKINPNWAPAYNIKANIQVELALYAQALADFDQAILLAPEAPEFRFNRAQLQFLLGDWEHARQDYEFRLHSPLFQPPKELAASTLWDGIIVSGKRLLAYWEQGLGDTLQFVRFADLLMQQGLEVVLEVQESLVSLIANSFPEATVVGPRNPLPPFDCRAPIPSLPWILGVMPDTLHAPTAYLRVPDTAVFHPPASHPAVGLVWAGNPAHVNDRQRSIALDQLLEVALTPGYSFYSLQLGITDKQRRALARADVIDLAQEFTDFSATATAIMAMDLVITVDTSIAHLAGALGKPVWVLLPFVPDWRWLLDRTDSPWYPSARLFRQPSRGDWRSVIADVKAALARMH